MKMPTPRGSLLMAAAGLLIALLAAAAAGWDNAGVIVGVAIAIIGFIAWQVAARYGDRDHDGDSATRADR